MVKNPVEQDTEGCIKRKVKNCAKPESRLRNRKTKREIDDDEEDFENHDTSEKGGYRKTTTSPEDEMNLHADGVFNTGEKKTENKITSNQVIRRSNRASKQQNRYGGGSNIYTKLLGVK